MRVNVVCTQGKKHLFTFHHTQSVLGTGLSDVSAYLYGLQVTVKQCTTNGALVSSQQSHRWERVWPCSDWAGGAWLVSTCHVISRRHLASMFCLPPVPRSRADSSVTSWWCKRLCFYLTLEVWSAVWQWVVPYNLAWVESCTDFPEIQKDDDSGKLKSNVKIGGRTIALIYVR